MIEATLSNFKVMLMVRWLVTGWMVSLSQTLRPSITCCMLNWGHYRLVTHVLKTTWTQKSSFYPIPAYHLKLTFRGGIYTVVEKVLRTFKIRLNKSFCHPRVYSVQECNGVSLGATMQNKRTNDATVSWCEANAQTTHEAQTAECNDR